MLDIIGSLFIAGYIGSILKVAFDGARSANAVRTLAAWLLAWVAGQGAILVLSAHFARTLQPNLLMFGLSLAMLSSAWIWASAFRRAAAERWFVSLLALHTWRLGGIFFLLLYWQHRLGSPFAPVAAIGDIITGAGAVALVITALHGRRPSRFAAGAWNLFGLVDLIVAVGLALLSTPGAPFQVFTDVPARSAFAALPWIFVPAAIVPALFFVHFAIALKLNRSAEGPNHGIS